MGSFPLLFSRFGWIVLRWTGENIVLRESMPAWALQLGGYMIYLTAPEDPCFETWG